MSWENYNPIIDNSMFTFDDEKPMRVGDGITVYEDDSKTAYLIVNINTDEQTASLYNYMSEEFETVPREKILEWRQNDAKQSLFVTSHEMTVLQSTDSEEIVGIKIHGSGTQYPQTIEQHGRNAFINCLRIAVRPGESGEEITEPYYPDETVMHPLFAGFVQSVKDDFVPILTEKTALPTNAAEELLDNILRGFEVVARSRYAISDDWYYFESSDDAKEQLENVNTNETSLENEFVVRGDEYGSGDMVIFH